MDSLLLMTVLVNSLIFYALLVFPVALIIYIAVQRPFRLMANNIRLALIEFCLLAILVLQIITINSEQSVFLILPIIFLCLICIAWLITVIVWVYLVVKKCRSSDYAIESNYSSQREEKEMEKKFKDVSYLMFNQTGGQDNLPDLLEMKELESPNNKSRLASARTRGTPK